MRADTQQASGQREYQHTEQKRSQLPSLPPPSPSCWSYLIIEKRGGFFSFFPIVYQAVRVFRARVGQPEYSRTQLHGRMWAYYLLATFLLLLSLSLLFSLLFMFKNLWICLDQGMLHHGLLVTGRFFRAKDVNSVPKSFSLSKSSDFILGFCCSGLWERGASLW